ncbi:MAG: response regulator [Deltaproteobacteria bacterium]|nr:response regulator [Deltaproteobacteria bacterium]
MMTAGHLRAELAVLRRRVSEIEAMLQDGGVEAAPDPLMSPMEEDPSRRDDAPFPRELIDRLPIPVAIYRADETIEYLNEHFVERFGYSLGDIPDLDTWWHKAYPEPDYSQEVQAKWAQAVDRAASGEVDILPREYRVRCKDDTDRIAEISGARIGTKTIVLLLDVTERNQAVEALRGERNFAEAVLDAIPGLVFLYDERGRLVRWNRQHQTMTGYTAEELVHKSMFDWVDKEGRGGIADAVQNVLTKGFGSGDLDVIRKDGQKLSIHVMGVRAEIAGETYIAGVGTDRTEAMQAEQERATLTKRLQQAQKLEAVGQLAAGVAHDFNNQLMVISGYAELLTAAVKDPLLQGFTEHISTSAARSAALTQRLLTFARRGQHQARPVNMHLVIEETLEIIRRAVPHKIVLTKALDAKSAVVMGDASMLQNALFNLAINARDAMPDGGELCLRSADVELDADMSAEIGGRIPSGPALEIVVEDNGVGMDDDVLEHLFDPFFTTKSKGTGLGLATVEDTLRRHSGHIVVDSAKGRGSRVRLLFPVAPPEQAIALAQANVSSPPQVGPQAHVLIIDDELLCGGLLAEALSSLGYNAKHQQEARSAIDYFHEHHASLDLVLLDMNMPVMNGREVFNALHEIDPTVKVLIVSGYSEEGDVEALLQRGAVGYLAKPFRARTLNELVNSILGSTRAAS